MSKDSYIYLALPNAMQPKKIGFKGGFRTSFIRPVHISYFHPENVLRIANYSGLSPAKLDTSGETIMLLKHSIIKKQTYPNLYVKQRDVFLKTGNDFLDAERKTLLSIKGFGVKTIDKIAQLITNQLTELSLESEQVETPEEEKEVAEQEA